MSGYDQALLAEAPAATKAQLQEGYNPDILRPNRTPPVLSDTEPDPESQSGPPTSKEHLPLSAGSSSPLRRIPFWRTRKGIIIIVIAVIVVIGAVVGGAVGGTVGKSSNKNNNAVVSGSSQSGIPAASASSSGSGQGIEQGAPITSSGVQNATTTTQAVSTQSSGDGTLQGGGGQ
ncbi:uncharacterized protein BT62DRAFT_922889 [Guyanagaster necrorhizus]|uniref:Uncharacterized protein n=1 Tax=Guyanagaster necrorhizus TaxID=856835 RepID=A0A9P8ANT3_9AGAR|nr:uncharacterized protein BT62DRAFT_922889 [Guyanagaster necrorhizus MCA 3950]KAG7442071.1 hypothetical protein BT62DRAFT_922889 [Guyanagaster necrorhizus MCA 3950]